MSAGLLWEMNTKYLNCVGIEKHKLCYMAWYAFNLERCEYFLVKSPIDFQQTK